MKNKATEKLFNLAYQDLMTNTYNRNAYEERLQKLRRDNVNLNNTSCVVVDINNLKHINDNFGHHTGDEAIRLVATSLSETIGTKADIFRVGGDEFVCIADCDIRGYISEFHDLLGFRAKEKIYPLSVAWGYAIYDSKRFIGIDDLIKYCDEIMFKNKKK